MPPSIQPRESYGRDAANTRRFREAVNLDTTINPVVRDLLLNALDSVLAGVHLIDDPETAKATLGSKAAKMKSIIDAANGTTSSTKT